MNQPIAGNYYPVCLFFSFSIFVHVSFLLFELHIGKSGLSLLQINLGIYMKDSSTELSVLVDQAVGGFSIVDGQLELMLHQFVPCLLFKNFVCSLVSHGFPMLHRRLVHDDSRGVAEVLNETVCAFDKCTGLIVRKPIRVYFLVRHFPYSEPLTDMYIL